MSPVPTQCESLEATVQEIRDALRALAEDMADPDLGPDEKAAIGVQLHKAREQLQRAERDLDRCIRDNSPPPEPVTPRLEVGYVQVVQTVQSPRDNELRLVRNKQTVVRVFVSSGMTNGFDAGAGPNRWPGVSGEVRVTDPATGFTTGPVAPFNPGGSIVALPNVEINQDYTSHSLNFRLPLVVVSAARLDISVRVFVRGHENDGGGWTAERSISIDLLSRPEQEITPILLMAARLDLPVPIPAPTFNDFLRILRRGALARFPVPFFRARRPMTLVTLFDLRGSFGWAATLAAVTTAALHTTGFRGTAAGLVMPASGNAMGGIGAPRGWLFVPSFVTTFGADVASEALFAHEMGHAHGLNHSVCRGDEPWLHDARLPARTDAIGVHVEDGTVIPRQSPEVMSYCAEPRWPSIATYNLIFDTPI